MSAPECFAEYVGHHVIDHDGAVANDHPEEALENVVRKEHWTCYWDERSKSDPSKALELVFVLPLLQTQREQKKQNDEERRRDHGVVNEEDIIRRRILLLEVDQAVIVHQDAANERLRKQVEGLHEGWHCFNQIDQLVF